MGDGRGAANVEGVSGCGIVRRVVSSLLAALALVGVARASDLDLVGVHGSKAALMLGGSVIRTLAVGQRSPEGVRLVSISGSSVVVEQGGIQQRLDLGGGPVRLRGGVADAPAGAALVILTADGRGHHVSQGRINGASVTFLVDTGASMVSIGRADAVRAGIDFARGQRGRAQTANGEVDVWRVKLDSVTLGGVSLTNVDGLVHEHDLPFVLLGRSFLNRMEMQSSGDRLILRRRY